MGSSSTVWAGCPFCLWDEQREGEDVASLRVKDQGHGPIIYGRWRDGSRGVERPIGRGWLVPVGEPGVKPNGRTIGQWRERRGRAPEGVLTVQQAEQALPGLVAAWEASQRREEAPRAELLQRQGGRQGQEVRAAANGGPKTQISCLSVLSVHPQCSETADHSPRSFSCLASRSASGTAMTPNSTPTTTLPFRTVISARTPAQTASSTESVDWGKCRTCMSLRRPVATERVYAARTPNEPFTVDETPRRPGLHRGRGRGRQRCDSDGPAGRPWDVGVGCRTAVRPRGRSAA